MVIRMIRATRKALCIRNYWLSGQKFCMETGRRGWYVIAWSDTVTTKAYWVVEGRFYQAGIRWIKAKTFELELVQELVEVDPKRRAIIEQAIQEWENHPKEHTFEFVASNESLGSSY